ERSRSSEPPSGARGPGSGGRWRRGAEERRRRGRERRIGCDGEVSCNGRAPRPAAALSPAALPLPAPAGAGPGPRGGTRSLQRFGPAGAAGAAPKELGPVLPERAAGRP
ncbi:unnamed protein product, partial [Prorocentrum cordatum]